MKNLFGKLLVVALLGVGFASCMKDKGDDSWYEEQIKNQKRIDSTLKAQEPILEDYALANFDSPVYDDSTGFWFEILAPATDDSYEYKINSSGGWVTPVATVKYKGELLNGTVFDEPSQPVEMSIVERSQFQNGLIPAWPIAFRPETIVFGGKEYKTGLIPGGLKKGHKIRFVAPSPYCYDNQNSEKIPANSPLVFTIEVININ